MTNLQTWWVPIPCGYVLQKELSVWEPMSEARLMDLISVEESWMRPGDLAFWERVRIRPKKWALPPIGDVGVSFWVVAVWGQHCIWFNDFEGGFDCSEFKEFGQIPNYTGGQEDLHSLVAGCNFGLAIRNAE